MHYVMQDTMTGPFFVDSIQYAMVFLLLLRTFVEVVTNPVGYLVVVGGVFDDDVVATSQRQDFHHKEVDY